MDQERSHITEAIDKTIADRATALRQLARSEADLARVGVKLRDTPQGTYWTLPGVDAAPAAVAV